MKYVSFIYFNSFTVFCVFIMLNMFISIIMDGYHLQIDSENMRINEETIKAFKSIWMKYDQEASGLIQCRDLQSFTIDLILKEIDMAGDSNNDTNVLFNLRLKLALTTWAKIQRGMPIDDKIMSQINKSHLLRRELKNAGN